ncbi:MAG: cation:H+ antiporter [Desulfobacteraceae bacterium Eth-SRB2]|nr:MAG: cation:H+ antiporter [Desulfobacteraceae bacterium Eth-SRB2]
MTIGFDTFWFLLGGFIGASFTMILFLNHLEKKQFEGTALGTLVMPYFSGAPNLIFTIVMAYRNSPGKEIVVNCLVNNMTNLSVLIGLPCIFWGLEIIPKTKKRKSALKTGRLNRLSLSFTIIAVFVFTGAVWALGRDGELTFGDGLGLVGMFFFWQLAGVFDVMRKNIERKRRSGRGMILDFVGLGISVAVMFYCVDGLVQWLSRAQFGFISYKHIGWLSGWLMVLPNAIPAFYYALHKRADIVYSSQIGDGHICIPLCIGLFAMFHTISVPSFFEISVYLILIMAVIHLFAVTILGRLPRSFAVAFLGMYGIFLYQGIISVS